MTELRRLDGIEHNAEIAAGGILHADRHAYAARRQSVLLVLYRTRSHRDIGKQVAEIAVIFRIEHFIRADKSGFLNGTKVQTADRNKAFEQIRLLGGIGLGCHALVALAGGARLIGVDARDNDDLVLYYLTLFYQNAVYLSRINIGI